MLKARGIFGIILLMAASCAVLAQSHQHPKAKFEGGKLGKDNRREQPAPTVTFPTSQEITDAIAAGIERANEKRETNHPAPPPDWFNFFLVIFTGLLVVVGGVNCYLIFWTLKATQIAADAAKQSADAIASIERPYIFVIAKPSKISAKDGPPELKPTISYSFTNLGRVPAVIRLVYARCFLAHQLSPPTYSQSKFKTSQSAIGAGSLPVCEFEEPLTDKDWADIKADKTGVVFMAIVLYEGALDYTYSTAITYRIDPFTGHAFAIHRRQRL